VQRPFVKTFVNPLKRLVCHILTRIVFRNTLVGLGETLCQSPEDFKAWSQKLGHEKVLTTFTSYGEVQSQRQSEIFQTLKQPRKTANQDVSGLAKALVKEMQKQIV